MTQGRRVGACLASGLVLITGGVWGAVADLDAADKVASVVGGLCAVMGLALSAYGVVLARRGSGLSGQSVTGSTVGGGVTQVRGVQGNLRIGPAGAVPPGPVVPPPAPFTPSVVQPGGQSVTGSQVAGPVHQVEGVGGDADIDR